MKFLIDENLPPRLAAWLNLHGHDALHAREASLLGAPDQEVLRTARNAGRIIITRDRDFDTAAPAAVLRLCIGNSSTPTLLAWLEPRLSAALSRLESGERLVLVD